MIHDIDETIRQLLIKELGVFGLVHGNHYDISFDMPDGEWEGRINRLTVDLFLYDLTENHTLRKNEQIREIKADRTIDSKKPPARFDCKYLVTAWSPTTPPDSVAEHRFFGQVLWALFRNPVIPAGLFQGYLQDLTPTPEVPTFTAQGDGLEMLGQFWSSLENQWKASFNYVVTIPLDLRQAIPSGPMVTTKMAYYQIKDKPDTREEYLLQIGGRIVDAADPQTGIADAEVTIVELGRKATTDRNGFYTFSKIPRGQFDLEAKAADYKAKTRTLQVPEPNGDYYIALEHI